jgi:lipid-binding SYLF domain-containing protein
MIANGYRSRIPASTALGYSILLSSLATGLVFTGQDAQGLQPNPLLNNNWAAALMVLIFQMPKT